MALQQVKNSYTYIFANDNLLVSKQIQARNYIISTLILVIGSTEKILSRFFGSAVVIISTYLLSSGSVEGAKMRRRGFANRFLVSILNVCQATT